MEPGKPAAGSNRTSPSAEMVPPSGVEPLSRSMRIVSPLATRTPVIPREPEARLVVAEFAVHQPHRSLRLRLRDGPAQSDRQCDCAGHATAGRGQDGVGETGVEPAVELEIQRAVARERRRSGDVNGIGAARGGGDVDRASPASEPARADDVERRQGVAARLRKAHLPQPDAPVAGWIARRSPDGRFAVGCSGRAEARRNEIERCERNRRRGRAKVKRRPGAT